MRRVAIVGAGRMGVRHAQAWLAHADRAKLVTVVARTSRPWIRRTGAEFATRLEAALARDSPDIVDICLPTNLHREAAELAFAAGKHVLVEKPIALTTADASAMIVAGRKAGRVLMVGHVVRFVPAYRCVAELVAEGSLGHVVHAHASRLVASDPDVGWLGDESASGGCLFDLLVHDYDQLNRYLGTPLSVVAAAATHGTADVLIRYDGGRTASVTGDMAMPTGYPFTTLLRLTCEGGVIELVARGVDSVVRVISGGDVRDIPVPAGDPYVAQVGYLLDRLDDGGPITHGSPEQARAAIAIASAAAKSATTYAPQDVTI